MRLEKVSKMWVFNILILIIWFVFKFVLHKGGYIHILLITAITIFVIQFLGYRKTRYHRTSSGH
jgi:uncharacterized membrane protein